MTLTELYCSRGFAIALMLFAMMTLLYADCPQRMCCPAGANCEADNALCKPSSSKDCQKSNALYNTFSIVVAV